MLEFVGTYKTEILIGLVILLIVLVIIAGTRFEKFRLIVYGLFIAIEQRTEESGKGKEKMAWVMSKTYPYLPLYIRTFISEERFEWILQYLFNKIKDYLDNGMFDDSTK